ncbi:ANTAR domain-containing response regulator [Arthrobacter sp. U41]|uniref:ANTAR domain-containing response regulator n=1 Tax=Arthrobacter sp. U41 TaxID=1849032 RepID=UPI0011A4CBA3|nr:ANTAR domain-containing protein [Arthrobacter sp. U41]
MSENNVISSTSQNIRDAVSTFLDLVLDSTETGSDVAGFLADLASLTAGGLSRPDREVSCGISITRRNQPSSAVGSSGEGSVSRVRIPFELDGEDSAVVNLYSPRAGAFSGKDLAEAHRFAADASRALLLALRISQLRESRQDLSAAMQSRTIIDMAIGAIMAQNRCGRDAAFKILRNTSNNRNLKIRDVAAGVVASIAGDTDFTTRFEE